MLAPQPDAAARGARPGHPARRALTAPAATVKRARRLRRTLTLPEVLLWQKLRDRPGGYKFRRQHPEAGFVCDFCCLEARLVIEVDGATHACGDQPAFDMQRDAALAVRGYATLRIAAAAVLHGIDAVVASIVAACAVRGPLHRPADGPPPRAGEEF